VEEFSVIGKIISHYQVIEKLGAGGMGVVYKTRDTHLERLVALKLLPPEKVADVERKRRFVREAKCASAINHPNIVTIYDIDSDAGVGFIAMEYVEGRTLTQLIPPSGLRADQALKYAAQVAGALAAAHSAGIIHRDLKPANVMVTNEGLVKVLDFGLAKLSEPPPGERESAATAQDLTAGDAVVGTAPYMSPEQIERRELDTRSDIFSFGALLYEMLTGCKAFQRESGIATMAAILHEEPRPVGEIARDVPSEVERIIGRCLQKNPQDRIHHTLDLKLTLEDLGRSLSSQGRGTSFASIAVLPFINMNRDEENEFLSDGITEDIINALMGVEGLHVAARSSVFQFKGKAPGVREVGQKLNVDAVLEGSVRRAGERLRVTAQLVKTADGFQLWSERYDRVMRDMFDIQDEISQAIVDKLKVRLAGEKGAPLVKRYSVDPEAYNLYLKGRHHWNKRTVAGYRKSVEHFQEACAKDPEFALPYVGLADAYITSAFWGSLNPREAIPKVEGLLKKALEIDEALAEGHASLGFLCGAFLWDWRKAESAFERSIRLNPNYAPARLWNACFSLAPTGRLEEAAREAERSIELEPLVPINYGGSSTVALWRRQYDLALAVARKVSELEPDFGLGLCCMAQVLCQEGSYEEAVATMQHACRILAPGGLWGPGLLGYCYARWGRQEEARRVLADLETLRERSYAQAVALAAVHAGLGEKDRALDWLERAFEEHCGGLGWARYDPVWDSLREEPRFQALLSKMNLAG
jgi:serine/threonine-protein kinase